MKTNFIIAILLSILFSNYSFGQNLNETTTWLEEKFKLHIIGNPKDQNLKEIEIYPCRISWTIEDIFPGKYGKSSTTYEFNPSEGQWLTYDFGIKNSKEGLIKITHFSGDTGEKTVGYKSDFYIYQGSQNNLSDNLIKALRHLSTFCG